MAVSKRTRFEVLRRDDHTCRYCGAKAPNVRLQVDHVTPKALGGSDEPSNLVTSCADCNSGKASSTPDAALVADIDRASLVWGRAMAIAAERMSYDRGTHAQLLDYFETEWIFRWSEEEEDYDGARDSMPPDWRSSLVTFYSSGLGVTELDEAIDIARFKPGLTWDARWKYFCGICWTKVREIQREARRMIDSGEVG